MGKKRKTLNDTKMFDIIIEYKINNINHDYNIENMLLVTNY